MNGKALLLLALGWGCLAVQSIAQISTPMQLTASNVHEDQDFGFSVDLDGAYAVVGAFRDEDGIILETGAAYVYSYNGATWEEKAKLESSVVSSLTWFGWDVAIDGDVLLVSARNGDTFDTNHGEVYVYRRNGESWVEETVLTQSEAEIQSFGLEVEIEDDVIAVGAPSRNGTAAIEGGVYVFRNNGAEWVEEDILQGENLSVQANFGHAIDIDGDRMLVSAFNSHDSTSNQAGKLFIFDYDGGQWNRTAELQSNRSNNIANLGVSVALEGEWAMGGAPLDNTLQSGAGAVLVYRYDGANWNFHSKLTASDGQGFFLFGSSMELSDNRLLVTAENWLPPGGVSTGKAYLFEYDEVNDVWVEVDGFAPAGLPRGANFGHATAMQGDVMLFGAPEYDGTANAMGAAFVYGSPTVATSNEQEVPETAFSLSGPYPNPFSERATIQITTIDTTPTRVVLHDMLGREIQTLYAGVLQAGVPRSLEISAGDLARGQYWIKIQTPLTIATRPLTLIK